MSTFKMAVMGIGAAGAAGVAVMTQPFGDTDKRDLSHSPAMEEVCLKGDFALFAGIGAGCYSRAQIQHMSDMPVVDRLGAEITVTMAHPTNLSVAPAECRTCRDFREARFDGWYAATSRDMRREAYFIRACGALSMLTKASKAEHSYFTSGSPQAEEVADFAGAMKFGESVAGPDALRVEKGQGHVWRVEADDLSIAIHELANADFDNDGIEEILAFTAGAPVGGTAAFYEVGLLEKDSPDAGLSFSPLDFSREDAAGAAG